jgi:hypothetical protein
VTALQALQLQRCKVAVEAEMAGTGRPRAARQHSTGPLQQRCKARCKMQRVAAPSQRKKVAKKEILPLSGKLLNPAHARGRLNG